MKRPDLKIRTSRQSEKHPKAPSAAAPEENSRVRAGDKFFLALRGHSVPIFATLLSRLDRERRLFTDRLGGDLIVSRAEIVVVATHNRRRGTGQGSSDRISESEFGLRGPCTSFPTPTGLHFWINSPQPLRATYQPTNHLD